jgi:hypothetical protein
VPYGIASPPVVRRRLLRRGLLLELVGVLFLRRPFFWFVPPVSVSLPAMFFSCRLFLFRYCWFCLALFASVLSVLFVVMICYISRWSGGGDSFVVIWVFLLLFLLCGGDV